MGKRLLPRADFHVGSHINKFMQLKTRQVSIIECNAVTPPWMPWMR
jgi:hypothetical protein